jgi:hypothetical protein
MSSSPKVSSLSNVELTAEVVKEGRTVALRMRSGETIALLDLIWAKWTTKDGVEITRKQVLEFVETKINGTPTEPQPD